MYYVGIDYHKRYSMVSAVDEQGVLVRGASARWLSAIPREGGGYHLMAQQQLQSMGRR